MMITTVGGYMRRLYDNYILENGITNDEFNPNRLNDFYNICIPEVKKYTKAYAHLIACQLKEKEQKYVEIGSGLYDNVSQHLINKGYDIKLVTPCLEDIFYANEIDSFKKNLRSKAIRDNHNPKIVDSILATADKIATVSKYKGTCVTDMHGNICTFNYVDTDVYGKHYDEKKFPQIEDFDTLILSPQVEEKEIFKVIARNKIEKRVVTGFCTSSNDRMLQSKIEYYKLLKKIIENIVDDVKKTDTEFNPHVYDHELSFAFNKPEEGKEEVKDGYGYILIYDPIKTLSSNR